NSAVSGPPGTPKTYSTPSASRCSSSTCAASASSACPGALRALSLSIVPVGSYHIRSRETPATAQPPLQRQAQRGGEQRQPGGPQLDVAVLVDAHHLRLAKGEAAQVVVRPAEVTIGNIHHRAQQAVARFRVLQLAPAAAHQEHLVVLPLV